MREITKSELEKATGKDSPAVFVACNGKVYDVSRSFLWQHGKHQVIHHAGRDLTGPIKEAPHGAEFLERFPVVGLLVED